MTAKRLILSVLALCLFTFTATGHTRTRWAVGADFSTHIVSTDDYAYRDGPRDAVTGLALLSPYLSVTRGDVFNGYLLADLYWLKAADDTPETSAEIINGLISFQQGAITATIGIQPITAGNGFLVDTNDPGITLEAILSGQNSFNLNLTVATLFDTSPFAMAGFETKPGPFERIRFFSAMLKDTDNFVADTLSPFLLADESSGHLFWLGVSGDVFIQDSFARFSVIVQQGEIDLSRSYIRQYITCQFPAFLADAELWYTLSDQNAISGFLHIRSGEKSLSMGTNQIFITPGSSQARSSIFFGDAPGFSDPDVMDYTGQTIPQGVLSPGIAWQHSPTENTLLELNTALFFSYNTDLFYGWETDLNVTWDITPRDAIALESACFVYADYPETADNPALRLAFSYRRRF